MLQEILQVNNLDSEGRPAGGKTTCRDCMTIIWQNGPLGRGEDRKEPNGAFVETVISAALGRLYFYQSSSFKCRENSLAITKLEEALFWLNHRTAGREKRKVEGTYKA